ncbi:MAG: mechanosensitive ion channel family protein [Bdellovibrionales bacterium]|nr:mechanosensitive ion channel family protein [Bdellovibrionales bacterium]
MEIPNVQNLLKVYELSYFDFIITLIVSIFSGVGSKLVLKGFFKFLKKLKYSVDQDLIDQVYKPLSWLLFSAVWIFSLEFLNLASSLLILFKLGFKLLFSITAIWFLYSFSYILSEVLNLWASKTDNNVDDELVPLFSKLLRFSIVLLGSLMALQNVGVNVMSVMAGLGLGGLALALAAKDTAANLFGSIMILLDRPFKVGDWIVVDDLEGTVEAIGFRSTRLKTFYQSSIIVPNSFLANASINNMQERSSRRLKFHLGVSYSTTPDQIEAFMQGIKNIILAHQTTDKELYYVAFDEFGDFSLNILVQCFFQVPDRKQELKARRILCMEMLRLAHKLKVEFAFPTQSLYVESFPGKNNNTDNKDSNQNNKILSREEMLKELNSFAKGGSESKPQGLGLYQD